MFNITTQRNASLKSCETLLNTRMAIIRKTKNNRSWRCGETGIFMHCWWKCKMIWPLWKAAVAVSLKLIIKFTILPKGSPQENSRHFHNNFYTMIIAALFVIIKNWKQPLSTNW